MLRPLALREKCASLGYTTTVSVAVSACVCACVSVGLKQNNQRSAANDAFLISLPKNLQLCLTFAFSLPALGPSSCLSICPAQPAARRILAHVRRHLAASRASTRYSPVEKRIVNKSLSQSDRRAINRSILSRGPPHTLYRIQFRPNLIAH